MGVMDEINRKSRGTLFMARQARRCALCEDGMCPQLTVWIGQICAKLATSVDLS